MLKSGLVVHYVKEYSPTEVENIAKTIKKSIDDKSIQVVNTFLDDNVLTAFAENLPIGTVLCYDISKDNKVLNVCFPVFSSHMSLPIKTGEIVWFFEENITKFTEAEISGHPLLGINCYWISRKIGGKISEDLNYSLNWRNALISSKNMNAVEQASEENDGKDVNTKKLKKEIVKQTEKNIVIPDYSLPEIVSKKIDFLPDPESLYENSKSKEETYPKAVPRWFSRPYEFSMQGSNNSLVNLTKSYSESDENKNAGAIDLVAGRHSVKLFTKPEKKDILEIKEKFAKNISDEKKRKIDITYNLNSPYFSIENTVLDKEILKSQKAYFGKELYNANTFVSEGRESFLNDASRIYVSENDNLETFSLYNLSFLNNQNSISSEYKTKKTSHDKSAYLSKVKNVSLENVENNFIKNSKNSLPSILLNTNNIRIIAREKKEVVLENSVDKGKVIEEGSIRLIKNSENFESFSHVSMENNGNLLLDGKTIFLGNFNKELIRHKKIKDIFDEKLKTLEDKDLKSLHGKGEGLLIGYDEKFSEPLVLGKTLEAMLKELININISLLNEVKTLSEELSKHTHVGIPITGISGPPQLPTPYVDFSTKKHADLDQKYKLLQENLNEMLSRFAKTS